ncbi:MAG: phosphatase PAP2 family protein, partial [Crocinitomicaceae bacterium]|nr:phosphatase PAP2 family protein [Crocinitomicaceae bacterium]
LNTLLNADRQLFLLLNGDYAAWLDLPMWYFSKTIVWIPVFIVLLVLLYKKYPGKSFVFVVLSVAVIITMCDRCSVMLFKNIFMRLRPSHEPSLEGLIHLVREKNGEFYRGGLYGFFSSHAANYSGIITFFIIVMRPVNRIVILFLVTWCLLISFSRIYLGVHYPGDVLAGLIFGSSIGWGTAQWFRFFVKTKILT